MGSNSNRQPSKAERIAGYSKSILEKSSMQSESDFQFSTGARIRGELGVEKGNKFIAAIRGVMTILILLSITIALTAQFREKPHNAVYLSYQPWDHGLGIRGDVHLNHRAGIYGSASYGKWGFYQQSGLGDHIKLTSGILIPYKDWIGNQYDFSLGLNYHWVSGLVIENEVFKDDPLFHKPWSFEIGLTIKMSRFALGVRTDILRWEPCIDIGIPIGRRNSFNQ
jgi:hypothetical protein